MAFGAGDGKTYGSTCMSAMMQAMVSKTVSARSESVYFEIRIQQTMNKFSSSLQYLGKMTEKLLRTDKFLKPIANMVRAETDKVVKARSKL